MPTILRSSLEHRVIEYASGHYPLTVDELAGALGVSAGRVMMELRRMESKGLVELDVLPDKVFVRLLVVEGNGSQNGGYQKKEGKGGDDPAYL
jgi:DNA-binding transcriptional ArsR family regulator